MGVKGVFFAMVVLCAGVLFSDGASGQVKDGVEVLDIDSGQEKGGEMVKSRMGVSGFSGGMMVHTGYVSSGNVAFYHGDGSLIRNMTIKGFPLGIGGAARAHFGKHLRVGAEGYASYLYYGENGSFESIGWGGLLVDGAWPKGKWTPFVGGTVGGGVAKNVTALGKTVSDFVLDDSTTSYRHYGFMVLVPFVGIEYSLTQRIHLVAKLDYMFNVSNPQADFVSGPRLYFGFMFCH